MEFEVLPTEQAVALRKAFIRKFVDTTSEHYQKHIATLIQDIDSFYYAMRGGAWFTVAFYNQRGDSTLDYCPLVALALLNIS